MKLKLATLLLFALAPLAQAHTVLYTVILSGAAEAPPNASTGTGTALITLDFDLVTMKVETTFSGLLGNVTAAHIHGPTAVAGTGTAGVMTMTPTFTGFPLGATFGTYSQTFDMTLSSSYNAAFVTANGGTVSGALNALNAAIQDGKSYLNIHTSSFPGGEIRGFLTPVPEPSVLLMGTAAAGLLTLRRRRSQPA
ncbi:MAG: sorting domain protein [Verrucomicrobiales bacterium]|nr:sorting domain protein [Verrucomicrobiales bacterium]